MANMSYCRFENTERDLQDCVNVWRDRENFDDQDADQEDALSESETRAKLDIIELAKQILEMEGYEVSEG